MDESKIKALYGELVGILSQTPERDGSLCEEESWEQYHETVSRLETETGEDFSRFRVKPYTNDWDVRCIDIVPFRQKVNALIMHIYYKYSPDPHPPFSGRPPSSINVSTNVSQSQQVYLQMILNFQSDMDKKLQRFPEDSKEKRWWGKVQESLGSISTMTELLSKCVETAKEYGLSIDDLRNLFGY